MEFQEDEDIDLCDEPAVRPRRRSNKRKFSIKRALESVRRRFQTQVSSFRIHGFLFAAVSALLIGINAATSPAIPWAFFPIAGWAIGAAGHLQALLNRRRELKELSQAQDAPEETGKTLRALQLSTGTWNQHRTAFLTVNAFVWGVNLWSMAIGGYTWLWAAIVTGAWGIGFGCHWMANSARRKFLKEKLLSLGLDPRTMKRGRLPFQAARASGGLMDKARAIEENLVRQYRENERLRGHWSDIEPLLCTAIGQIDELEKKRSEFDQLMRGFSVTDLEEDLENVRRKERLTADPLLKKEYERSIIQYEHHLKAASGLARHRELLDLRLNGAYHLLKQLEIDTARLLSVDSYAEPSSLAALRAKTEENQIFIEDFARGLTELEREM